MEILELKSTVTELKEKKYLSRPNSRFELAEESIRETEKDHMRSYSPNNRNKKERKTNSLREMWTPSDAPNTMDFSEAEE